MSIEPREKIKQKSVCIKSRQDDFLYWAEQNIPNFDWNRLVRDKLDEQINIFNQSFL
jgi:hypothetical protein